MVTNGTNSGADPQASIGARGGTWQSRLGDDQDQEGVSSFPPKGTVLSNTEAYPAAPPGPKNLHLEMSLVWVETPPLDPVTGDTGELEAWVPALADAYRAALVALQRQIEMRAMMRAARGAAWVLWHDAAELTSRARRAVAASQRRREERESGGSR